MIYLLSPVRHEAAVSLPMITFRLLPQTIDVSGYDLLLFTSKQAVKSLHQLQPKWVEIPALSIGEATSRVIEELGGRVVLESQQADAKSFAETISQNYSRQKILYVRPQKVSFEIASYLLQQGMKLDEKIVYQTECVSYAPSQRPPKGAVIIFTSPSTITCFLQNFAWDESYKAVVIGKTTQKALPSYICAKVAKVPQIEASVAKAKEILLSSNSN